MDEINFCALLASSLNAAVVVETRNEQALNADLVLGQSSKKLYGRFLGKNVTVHQYTQVYCIPFAPEMNTAIARGEMKKVWSLLISVNIFNRKGQ